MKATFLHFQINLWSLFKNEFRRRRGHIFGCCFALCIKTKNYKKRNKSREQQFVWTKEWLLKRPAQRIHINLVKELRVANPLEYKNYRRITEDNFCKILSKIENNIKGQDNKRWQAIPPNSNLAVTTRFLVNGAIYMDL